MSTLLGIEWAKRIADNYADKPGAPEGNQNAAKNNSYARNYCFEEKQRGNSKAYLLERLPEDVVAEIGEGKRFKTVHEAARKTGVIAVPSRYYIPSDAASAGRYLAQRVKSNWQMANEAEALINIASERAKERQANSNEYRNGNGNGNVSVPELVPEPIHNSDARDEVGSLLGVSGRTKFPPPPSTLIAHLTAKLTIVDREVDGEYIGKRGINVDGVE